MAEITDELSIPLPIDMCFGPLMEGFQEWPSIWKRYHGPKVDRASNYIEWIWGDHWVGKLTIDASLRPSGSNETNVLFALRAASARPNALRPFLERFIQPYRARMKSVVATMIAAEAARQEIGRRISEGILCPACGKELQPGTRFCPDDGTPIARVCAKCNSNNAPSATFCTNCGTKF